MLPHASALAVLLSGTTLFTNSAICLAVEDPPPATRSKLTRIVETYFRTEDRDQRKRLVATIEAAAHGSIEAVAEAVRTASLWERVAPKHGHFYLDSPAIGRIKILYQVPEAYDPRRAYPMLLAMPGDTAGAWQDPRRIVSALRRGRHDLIVIQPKAQPGGSFHDPSAKGTDLSDLLREVRRLFHVDTDRVYLRAGSRGGDSAWMAALMHADLFAGVAYESFHIRLPYPEQSYPIFLPNLLGLLHGEQPIELLERRRYAYTRRVSKWFRYPGQGHAQWLRMTKFSGPIWEAEQLSILPGPSVDYGEFITRVLEKKLAYLGGQIEGQHITIETRKCARIDLLLGDELIDLDRSITVRVNGRRRHSGMVERSTRVLLETAYKDWDFQRLFTARLTFSIARDAPVD